MSDEAAKELPRIPELEGDYELIRELGRGGTAVVYLARERDVERYVAIKLMHPGYVQDEEGVARLMREARTVARLQHPNIVMLLGVRRLGDRGYALILQYVPGTTVKERIRRDGPLPIPLAERILTDLGSALQYAHRHRIVHRDIKPENVFLDADTGVSRLADFGIARFWDSDSGLTLPGTAIGTPTYMSPEQVDGRDLDGRSDLYSVGLVAWEMLTGQPPWAGETMYKIVYKQKHEELPSLEELRPEVPYYIRAAIEKALRKDPNDRWRDAGEFLAALQNPYAHLARPTPGKRRATPSASPLEPPPDSALEDARTILFNREEMARRMEGEGGERESPPSPQAGGTPPPSPRKASPPPPGAAAPGPAPPPPGGPTPSWLLAVEQGAVGPAGGARRLGPLPRGGGIGARGAGSPGAWRPATVRGEEGGSRWGRRRILLLAAFLATLAAVVAGVLLLGPGEPGTGSGEGGPGPLPETSPAFLGGTGPGGEPPPGGEPGAGEGTSGDPDVGGEGGDNVLDRADAPGPPAPPAEGSPSSSTAPPVAIVDEGEGPRRGPAGSRLPERVVIRVVDDRGEGVGGVDVIWEVLTGGGSLERVAGRTGPRGTASNAWTLGGSLGIQTLRVRMRGRDGVDGMVTAEALPPSREEVVHVSWKGGARIPTTGVGPPSDVGTPPGNEPPPRMDPEGRQPASRAGTAVRLRSAGRSPRRDPWGPAPPRTPPDPPRSGT